MARGTTLLTSLTAGEISPLLDVRTDIAKYKNGAKELQNVIVMPHGGVRKRPGFRFIQEVRTSSNDAPLLVPYQSGLSAAYVLELGVGYLRFYRDQGIITGPAFAIASITRANPAVVTTTVAHGYVSGQQVLIASATGMLEINTRRYAIAVVGASAFQLVGIDSTNYGTYTGGGLARVPAEIGHTYQQSQFDELSFAQWGDSLYIAHSAHPLRKLVRSSDTAWALSDVDIRNGPFRTINGDTTHGISVAPYNAALIAGVTQGNPGVVTTVGPHNFGEGASVDISAVVGMVELNGNKYIARNVTANTFELWTIGGAQVNATGFTAYVSGGAATISTTMFGTIAPGSLLTLTSSKALFNAAHVGALWRLWEPGLEAGAAKVPAAVTASADGDQITNEAKVYGLVNFVGANEWNATFQPPTHEEGVVRTYNLAGDRSVDVVYLHDSSCVVEITEVSNSQLARARVVRNHVPSSVLEVSVGGARNGNGTNLWEEGAWSVVRGFPREITLHASRLWAASSQSDLQHVWTSRAGVGAFEDFQDGANDDDAIVAQMASSKVEIARWFRAAGKALLLGTASAEHAIAAAAANQPLSPSNIQIVPQSPYGSSKFKPIAVGDAIIFGERNGDPANPAKRLREANYSLDVDKYVAPDLTIISEHITGQGVTEGAFQAAPDPVVWARRTDGVLAGLTYEPEQEVKGWHRQVAGGTAPQFERVTAIPGTAGDELWAVIRRTIGGVTKRYIEVVTTGLRPQDSKQDAVYLDSALTYSGGATGTIYGLWQLEGEQVYALVNGAKQGPFTVTNGVVNNVDPSATLAHIGLRYTSIIETVDIDAMAQSGTAKSRAKRISQLFISVYRSLGGRCGPSADKMLEIQYRTPADVFGSSPELRTELVPFDFPSGWDREARIRIEHDEPYPFTFLGVAAEMRTEG